MKIIGIDLSTHTGFAVIDSETGLGDHGVIHLEDLRPSEAGNCALDFQYIFDAKCMATNIMNFILTHPADYIVIEQTNGAKNRTSQKRLEFLHFALLETLYNSGKASITSYIDTSYWRKTLGIKLSKEQRQHNKDVKAKTKAGGRSKAGEGKITTKHLSVEWANKTYGLSLKLCQNDTADAIALAACKFKMLDKKNPPPSSIPEIEKLVAMAKPK